jgi:hypothetical protein
MPNPVHDRGPYNNRTRVEHTPEATAQAVTAVLQTEAEFLGRQIRARCLTMHPVDVAAFEKDLRNALLPLLEAHTGAI